MVLQTLLIRARTSWRHTLAGKVYDLLPSILFNIMLLPFVFVHPVQNWIGERAFFCFVLTHLAFYPGGNTIGAHLELVMLGTVCSTLWLGLAYLIVCAQVWLDEPDPIYSSQQTRGLGAAYLFFTFFAGGVIWSHIPRLRSAMRVTMFMQVWALTGSSSAITASNFTELFYPLIVTSVLSLVANLCFPRTAGDAYYQAATQALHLSLHLVDEVVENFDAELRLWITRNHAAGQLPNTMGPPPALLQSRSLINARRKLEKCTDMMRQALAATKHEVTWCRVPVTQVSSLLPYLLDLGAWMNCGFGMEIPALPIEVQTLALDAAASTADPAAETQGAPTTPEASNVHDAQTAAPTGLDATSSLLDDLSPLLDKHKPLQGLFTHLQEALASILVVTEVCYGCRPTTIHRGTLDLAQALHHATPHKRPRQLLAARRDALQQSIDQSRSGLHRLIERRLRIPQATSSTTLHPSGSPTGATPLRDLHGPHLFRRDIATLSFYALSMIELSYRTLAQLDAMDKTVQFYESHPHARFFVTKPNLRHWFFSSTGLDLFQNFGDTSASNEAHPQGEELSDTPSHTSEESPAEEPVQPDHLEQLFDDIRTTSHYRTYAMNTARASNYTHPFESNPPRHAWMDRLLLFVRRVARKPSVLRVRIHVSLLVREAKRSRHVQFGLKLAGGVLLLCIPAFLQPGENAWWNTEHGQWMVISYIWCLEASTGDSIRISLCRIIGTIAGAILGLIAFEISRGNPYGLAVLVVVFEIPASMLRMHSRYPPIGTVMGLTTPIVALVTFLDGPDARPEMVAVVRGYMICLGIVAALLVNTLVWPYHARNMLSRELSRMADDLQTMYMNLTRHLFYVGFYATPESHKRFGDVERTMRSNIAKCYALIEVMSNELSLVPKPITMLAQVLLRLQTIFHLLVGLRMCREHGLQSLRQKAVWDVADLRQEVASAIMLNLWVIGQSMLTRSRLPEFLPSAREPLEELTAALAQNHGQVFYDRGEGTAMQAARRTKHDPYPPTSILSSARSSNIQLNQPPIITMHLKHESPVRSKDTLTPPTTTATTDGMLYLLSEHVLLLQLVASLEALLQLARYLLGELRLAHTESPL